MVFGEPLPVEPELEPDVCRGDDGLDVEGAEIELLPLHEEHFLLLLALLRQLAVLDAREVTLQDAELSRALCSTSVNGDR